MVYLKSFELPSAENECGFFMLMPYTCYKSYYPFQIIARERRTLLEFDPITILYGENGSGKTTVLNVIANTLKMDRFSSYNKTSFFDEYSALCKMEFSSENLREKKIIASDDVFDVMFRQRKYNEEVDAKRQELFSEYDGTKELLQEEGYRLSSIDDLDELKKINFVRNRRKNSKSDFIRNSLSDNLKTYSNGESAVKFFSENVKENSLYLLDEPENSLSPQSQLLVKKHIENYARFFGCQFIIATHSPFFLSIKGAKIYNMDNENIETKKWTELPNVQAYFDLFMENKKRFEEKDNKAY